MVATAPAGRPRTRRRASSADPVTAYALHVTAGKIVAGPHVRAACRRHLDDLDQGPARGLFWDVKKAQHVFDFFEQTLKLTGGEFEGVPFVLLDYQKFIIGSLFGWVWKATGFRRFRFGYIETAKGSGKTPLTAGLALYMLVADGEARAECYSAARTKAQASLLFQDAVNMGRLSAFADRLHENGENPVWELRFVLGDDTRFMKPISPDHGKSGPRPHFVAVDEVHEIDKPYLIDMLRQGFKHRRQPMMLLLTNSGQDKKSLCGTYHEQAAAVAAGVVENDQWFGYIACLDAEDEQDRAWMDDPACWIKANPGLGGPIKRDYLTALVEEARQMPSKLGTVARLNFSIWFKDIDAPWVNWDLWEAGRSTFDPDELRGLPCTLALDLSACNDLTALAAAWESDGRIGEPGDTLLAVWFWTPEDSILDRAGQDEVPYLDWDRDGHIEAVPGMSIDHGFVAQKVAELAAVHDIKGLAFDPWRIKDFLRECAAIGLKAWLYEGPDVAAGEGLMLVKHGQGTRGGGQTDALWMPRSFDGIETTALNRRLHWRDNPCLNWCSNNGRVWSDSSNNRRFVKTETRRRIDGLVAGAMAVGLSQANLAVKPRGNRLSDRIKARGGLA